MRRLLVLLVLTACGGDKLAPIERGQRPTGDTPAGITVPKDDGDDGEPDDPGDVTTGDDGGGGGEDPGGGGGDGGGGGGTDPAPNVCEELVDLAGDCPGYGYDCDGYTETESWCLFDLLETLPDPCSLFEDASLCSGPVPSQAAIDNCRLQECFGMNTYDNCYDSLAIECDFAWTW